MGKGVQNTPFSFFMSIDTHLSGTPPHTPKTPYKRKHPLKGIDIRVSRRNALHAYFDGIDETYTLTPESIGTPHAGHIRQNRHVKRPYKALAHSGVWIHP
jgi:hypothetical protein